MGRALTEDELREFEHTWDGSETWQLIAHHWTKITLTVVFATEGPSVAELMALRRLCEEFRVVPVQELKAFLANKGEIQLRRVSGLEAREIEAFILSEGEGRSDLNYFSSMEAHEIEDRAAHLQVPFAIRSQAESGISYTPVQYMDGQERVLLIDEDEELEEAVTREMLRRGVPVVISPVEE